MEAWAGGTAAWAPSLGIEYHLGVDGLGALMLVLSAIVTLMSVDAAHRVHHQPGLYFGWCWCWSRDSSDRSRR
jgi:NADH:ubiquinone oxidoreductase subunit 4 (subunit M)